MTKEKKPEYNLIKRPCYTLIKRPYFPEIQKFENVYNSLHLVSGKHLFNINDISTFEKTKLEIHIYLVNIYLHEKKPKLSFDRKNE